MNDRPTLIDIREQPAHWVESAGEIVPASWVAVVHIPAHRCRVYGESHADALSRVLAAFPDLEWPPRMLTEVMDRLEREIREGT